MDTLTRTNPFCSEPRSSPSFTTKFGELNLGNPVTGRYLTTPRRKSARFRRTVCVPRLSSSILVCEPRFLLFVLSYFTQRSQWRN